MTLDSLEVDLANCFDAGQARAAHELHLAAAAHSIHGSPLLPPCYTPLRHLHYAPYELHLAAAVHSIHDSPLLHPCYTPFQQPLLHHPSY